MLIALNKPCGVLSQFTSVEGRRTLADLVPVRGLYAAGRLDFDSEGLLLLTDSGELQHAIADPENGLVKSYWAQVEGIPEAASLQRLADGIDIGCGADRYRARPATAAQINAPGIAERNPPIRQRARIPTSWLEVRLAEGKNRQVRRMTAAIGYPTLRLIRVAIGDVDLFKLGLLSGTWANISPSDLGLSARSLPIGRSSTGKRPAASMSTGLRKRRYWG